MISIANSMVNGQLVLKLPLVSILLLFLGISISPFLYLGKVEVWHVVVLFVALINVNYFCLSWKKFFPLFVFMVFVSLYYLVFLIIDPVFLIPTARKQMLFLVSFSIFLLMVSYSGLILTNQKKYIATLNVIVVLITFYGLYQCIGRLLDWPFTGNDFLRFRSWKIAGIYQISSFFEEPAFYGQYLVSFLFIHLMILKFRYKFIIGLLALNIVLTLSVGTYILTGFVVFCYILSVVLQAFVTTRVTKIGLTMVVLICVSLFFVSQSAAFSYVSNRFESLTISERSLKAQKRIRDESGSNRLQGEIEMLKSIATDSKMFFGYGINYENSLKNRKMALNGFTEITVRWGLFGLILFVLAFAYQIFSERMNFKWYFVGFVFLYFFMDGAIAKASFWLFPGLVYLFCKLDYRQKLFIDNKNPTA